MRRRIERAQGRELFGADPEGYDHARRGHAEEVYETLRDRCGLGPGTAVLEVGAGTGQATRRLLELGADPLVALEPDPRLAEFLRARLGDRFEIDETTLEAAELDRSFDLAAAASSFHWVEEEIGLAKLHDALRAGGWVALWLTQFGDDERPDPFRDAVDPLFVDVPDSPSSAVDGRPYFGLDGERRQAALVSAGFMEPEHELFSWSSAWDADGIRALYGTFSPIRSLPTEQLAGFLDAVARIAEDEFGGRVERPLVTSLFTARKPV